MGRLRLVVVPGLLFFHLILLSLAIFRGSVDEFNAPQTLADVWSAATPYILWSQLILTALWVGLGPGVWLLRIAGCAALAALIWIGFCVVPQHQGPGATAAWIVSLCHIVTWIVLVGLMLIFRLALLLIWPIKLIPTTPLPVTRRWQVSSLVGGMLLLVASWTGVVMLLRESYPWSLFAEVGDRYQQTIIAALLDAALVGVVLLPVSAICVGLTLTRLADWLFYQRRWTLVLLAVAVLGVFVFLLGIVDAPLEGPVQVLLAILVAASVVVALPTGALLAMGLSGYRLAVVKQSLSASVTLQSGRDPGSDDASPVSVLSGSLWGAPGAALVALVALAGVTMSSGQFVDHKSSLFIQASEQNEKGQTTSLVLRPYANDVALGAITNRSQVEALNLQRTHITDAGLAHLRGMENLKRLRLDNTKVTSAGLVHLAGLTRLQVLSLADTKVSDAGLVQLTGLTDLKQLNLEGTLISDRGLSQLAGLQLEELAIPHVATTDIGLKHYLAALGTEFLRNVTQWSLAGWRIGDDGVAHLKQLPKLRQLDLTGTQVTGPGLMHLEGMKLKSLRLPDGARTDKSLIHYLRAIEPQEVLDLASWAITDVGLEPLPELARPQTLWLSNTQVTDMGLVHLAGMTSLNKLDIRGNQGINGSGLTHLVGLSRLTQLDLRNSNMTDAGLIHLIEMKSLTYLDLRYTQITDTAVASLLKMTQLETIHFPNGVTRKAAVRFKRALPNCRVFRK